MSFDVVRFGDLFLLPQRNGLSRPKSVRGVGFPMVNMGELFAHARILNVGMDLVRVSDTEAHFFLEPGDLLFARQSLVLSGAGQCSIFLGNKLPTVFESHLIRCRLDPARSSPAFYFYFFRSRDGRRAIDAIVEQGAGASGIRGSDLVKLEVPCPSKEVQEEIAQVLGALDDRITLLRETNATLEAIAQALFKSWFVDFDPVRAKMEGRVPEGIDEATAALFPDRLGDCVHGLVPRGWHFGKLADFVASHGGSIQTGPFGSQLHASDYEADGVPVVMPKDINLRRISTLSIARIGYRDVERLSRHKLAAGDIVFSRRGDVGRHALVTEAESGWLCGTGCLLIRPGAENPAPTYLSLLLDTPAAKAWLVQHAVGATMPNLNTGILGSVPMVMPSKKVLEAFEGVVSILEESRSANAAYAHTLSAVRDTLLPRLISGQLRMPAAEPA